MNKKSASNKTDSHYNFFLRFNMMHSRMMMSAVGTQGDFQNSQLSSGIFGNLLCPLVLGAKEKKTGIIKRKVPNNSYVVRTEVLEEDEEEDLGKPHFSPSTFHYCSLKVQL
jgi:hypothetical protein